MSALSAFMHNATSLEEDTNGQTVILMSDPVAMAIAGQESQESSAVGTDDLEDAAVTYAKMQNVSAASRLLGRGSASGAGDVQEIALGAGLAMNGTTLEAVAEDYIYLDADYTLTNTTAVQKLFDTSTNGRLTIPSGIYAFESFIVLTGMSATSGNGQFQLVGAGTATLENPMGQVVGIDNNTIGVTTTRTGTAFIQNQASSGANMLTAATGTGMVAMATGLFKCTVGGTIIPSIALTTAAAAVVEAGSYFRLRRLGDADELTKGSWD